MAVRDAHFDGELSTNFASRDLDGDVLWQIRISQMPTLLHLEFQAGPDAMMGRHVWEYNTEASIRYKQPVKSVVIYLKTSGSPSAEPPYQLKLPNGEIVHNFAFSIVELRKLRAEQLFQTGLKGVLPLVPLTQEGQRHDAIERVIDEIQQPGVKRQEELLS